ncbi:MAG: accessory factor UbiK family protein [Immundisolibacter sp.]|uniref:accessory factor UbiK family protein n=1 Tax=Immundisolibacter sp. TaxID=1934948 RepID=UPI003D127850
MTDAAPSGPLQWLQGLASELDGLRTVAVQRLSQQAGMPSREEFEVQRALLEDARRRLDALQAQLEAVTQRLNAPAD